MKTRRPNKLEQLKALNNELEAQNKKLTQQIVFQHSLDKAKAELEPDPEVVDCDVCALQIQIDDACGDVKTNEDMLVNYLAGMRVCRKFNCSDKLREIYLGMQCLLAQNVLLAELDGATAAYNLAECRSQCAEEMKADIEDSLCAFLEDDDIDERCKKIINRVLNVC